MWTLHSMLQRRSVCSLALLTSILAVPAFAQTSSESDHAMQDQRQTRVESQPEHNTETQSQAASHSSQPRITADIQTQPQAELTSEEKQARSQAAGRLLLHVDNARQALENKDKEGALSQINKGLILARIIERTAPVAQVHATIQAGDLVYEDQDTVRMTNVPIYTELGEVSTLAPVEAAKREATKSQMAKIPVVQDVELQHTAVTLDAMNAKRHLKAAKAALTEDQPQAADQALAAIQTSGVSFAYTEMDLPLIRARENLTLAKHLVTEQRPEAARAALQEAAQALSAYGKRADAAHTTQVQTLQQQITDLSQNLDANKEDAAGKISRLWDQVTQLAG